MTPSDPLELAAWSNRGVPSVARVRANVWVIPVPAPGVAIGYTLCYVVREGESYVVIDPGWESEEGWDVLAKGLGTIGSPLSSIRGIIGTHAHPDHIGLAERLQLATGAWFALGENEPLPTSGDERSAQAIEDDVLLATWGVPTAEYDELNIFRSAEAVELHVPPVDVVLHDGQITDDVQLRVISTPGHTPGHICLSTLDSNVLFTGDHVLPRISPHTSVWIGGTRDPIRVYRASLKLLDFSADTLVCPGHEYRFNNVRLRTRELEEDHQRRSDEVLALMGQRSPKDIWTLAPLVTWSRGWDSLTGMTRRLALAQCASHVEYLAYQGALVTPILTRPHERDCGFPPSPQEGNLHE